MLAPQNSMREREPRNGFEHGCDQRDDDKPDQGPVHRLAETIGALIQNAVKPPAKAAGLLNERGGLFHSVYQIERSSGLSDVKPSSR